MYICIYIYYYIFFNVYIYNNTQPLECLHAVSFLRSEAAGIRTEMSLAFCDPAFLPPGGVIPWAKGIHRYNLYHGTFETNNTGAFVSCQRVVVGLLMLRYVHRNNFPTCFKMECVKLIFPMNLLKFQRCFQHKQQALTSTT